MTAATAPLERQAQDPTGLLRTALRLDALVSGAAGVGLLAGSLLLDGLLGIPSAVLAVVGVALVGWGGLWLLAARPRISGRAVAAVMGVNLAWVTVSAAVAMGAWLDDVTTIGRAFVVLQALAVLALTDLQAVGLRRARAAA